jgi:hypothetical protein
LLSDFDSTEGLIACYFHAIDAFAQQVKVLEDGLTQLVHLCCRDDKMLKVVRVCNTQSVVEVVHEHGSITLSPVQVFLDLTFIKVKGYASDYRRGFVLGNSRKHLL